MITTKFTVNDTEIEGVVLYSSPLCRSSVSFTDMCYVDIVYAQNRIVKLSHVLSPDDEDNLQEYKEPTVEIIAEYATIPALDTTKTEIDGKSLSNGEHFLSGVDDIQIDWEGYDEKMIDAKVFIIDNEPYCVFTDPEDGYRSYGIIYKLNKPSSEVCHNNFPPQKVKIQTIEETNYRLNINNTTTIISNIDTNETIVKIGTDYSDTYYPIAIFEYHPENLPINK